MSDQPLGASRAELAAVHPAGKSAADQSTIAE